MKPTTLQIFKSGFQARKNEKNSGGTESLPKNIGQVR